MNLILDDQDDELQLFKASETSKKTNKPPPKLKRKVNTGFSQFADE